MSRFIIKSWMRIRIWKLLFLLLYTVLHMLHSLIQGGNSQLCPLFLNVLSLNLGETGYVSAYHKIFEVCSYKTVETLLFLSSYIHCASCCIHLKTPHACHNPKNQTILFDTMVLKTMWTFKFNFPQMMKIGHIYISGFAIVLLNYV